MDTFLIRLSEHTSPARVRARLQAEAAARVLLSSGNGTVLVAAFDRALRETVARWPEVALVGGITFARRPLRRIRVDQAGRPLPAAPPPA